MRIYVLICLFLGSSMGLQATLFFWNNVEDNSCCLHYDSYDICVGGGGYTGFNHIDIPRIKKYINDKLLINQTKKTKLFLKQLLNLLKQYSVVVPYKKQYSGTINQIVPRKIPAKEPVPAKSKILTAAQKRDAIQRILAAKGLSRPVSNNK